MERKAEPEPSLRDSKSALLAAAQAAVAERRARPPAGGPGHDGPRPSRRRAAFRVTLGALLIAGSAVLLARPPWLVGPSMPPESAAVRAASATLALVEAVSRVQAFQAARGRLPATLPEAGVDNPAIDYRRTDTAGFVVSLAAGDSTVTLRSTDSLKAVVVQAILTLQRRS